MARPKRANGLLPKASASAPWSIAPTASDWIRFYTLDGFTRPEDRGWDSSYNFGSRDSVRIRWRVALEAGVDLIATDQYEDLAAVMKAFRQ